MFSSGSKIDLKQIEEELKKEIEVKAGRLFTTEELEELKQLELNLIPNPDRIRPFFHQELTFPDLKRISESLAHNPFFDTDYNIDLNTFLASSHSSSGKMITWLRSLFRPFFRLYGNIDALIHKQAMYNAEQVQFNVTTIRNIQGVIDTNEKSYHYIRTLHTLVNYLVAELTKLNLQQQTLKGQVEALSYDLDQLRKRERLLEKMATLKEES